MPIDTSGSISPTNHNDEQFFSLLRSKNPENKLKECVTDAVTREAFKEFAFRHPQLIESSPLLNKASSIAKELDISEAAEYDSTVFAFQGLNYLAAKIYSWTYGHFSKGTQELERIILTEPEKLAEYLRAHPLNSADAELINAYLEAGTLSQKQAIEPFLFTPGVIIKLISVGNAPVPWVDDLIRNNPEELKIILSFTQLNGLESREMHQGLKHLLLHMEYLYDTQPELAIGLLSQLNAEGESYLTQPSSKREVANWLHSNKTSRPKLVFDVLAIRDRMGKTLLMSDILFIRQFSNFLSNQLKDNHGDVVDLLGMQDNRGYTVFMRSFSSNYSFTTGLKELYPLMKKLTDSYPNETLELFKKQNDWKETLLMLDTGNSNAKEDWLRTAFSLLKTLAEKVPEGVLALLTIKDEKGQTAMTKICQGDWLNESLKGFNLLNEVIEIIGRNFPQSVIKLINDMILDDTNLIFDHSFWNTYLPFFMDVAKNHPKDVLSVLQHRDNSEKSVLENRSIANKLLLLFQILADSPETRASMAELLISRDKNGNTIFHSSSLGSDNVENQLINIVNACDIDLNSLTNKYGFTPLDLAILNEEWLKQLKPDLIPIPDLTEKEFTTKAEALKTYVLNEWNSYDFGYGPDKINPHDLDVDNRFNATDAAGKLLPIKPEEIENLKSVVGNALKEMLDRIELKTPFLMTPRADDKKGLHKYYTRLLTSMETIVESMKKGNIDYRSGTLVTAARTQIAGRCGTAYRRELAQQARLCSPKQENLTLEQQINEAANIALDEMVNTIVGERYNGDVHYMQEFLYAAGLEAEGDHISSISASEARKIIAEHGDFYRFLETFSSNIDNETLTVYLKSLTPDDFDEGYLGAMREAKKMEVNVLFDAKKLLSKVFPRQLRQTALDLLISMRGPSLLAAVTSPSFISSGNFIESTYIEGMNELNSKLAKLGIALPEIPKMPSEISSTTLDAFETELKDTVKKQIVPLVPNTLRLSYGAIAILRETLQRATDFDRNMQLKGFKSPKQYAAMIQTKESLITELNKIAEEIVNKQPEDSTANLSYEARNGSLPSQIFDNTRRLEYNKETIGSEPLTVIETLFSFDILQEVQYDVHYD